MVCGFRVIRKNHPNGYEMEGFIAAQVEMKRQAAAVAQLLPLP
jgi:hypothetical protein